jgi:hypothetical protein
MRNPALYTSLINIRELPIAGPYRRGSIRYPPDEQYCDATGCVTPEIYDPYYV